jgi:hypothetical protein
MEKKGIVGWEFLIAKKYAALIIGILNDMGKTDSFTSIFLIVSKANTIRLDSENGNRAIVQRKMRADWVYSSP